MEFTQTAPQSQYYIPPKYVTGGKKFWLKMMGFDAAGNRTAWGKALMAVGPMSGALGNMAVQKIARNNNADDTASNIQDGLAANMSAFKAKLGIAKSVVGGLSGNPQLIASGVSDFGTGLTGSITAPKVNSDDDKNKSFYSTYKKGNKVMKRKKPSDLIKHNQRMSKIDDYPTEEDIKIYPEHDNTEDIHMVDKKTGEKVGEMRYGERIFDQKANIMMEKLKREADRTKNYSKLGKFVSHELDTHDDFEDRNEGKNENESDDLKEFAGGGEVVTDENGNPILQKEPPRPKPFSQIGSLIGDLAGFGMSFIPKTDSGNDMKKGGEMKPSYLLKRYRRGGEILSNGFYDDYGKFYTSNADYNRHIMDMNQGNNPLTIINAKKVKYYEKGDKVEKSTTSTDTVMKFEDFKKNYPEHYVKGYLESGKDGIYKNVDKTKFPVLLREYKDGSSTMMPYTYENEGDNSRSADELQKKKETPMTKIYASGGKTKRLDTKWEETNFLTDGQKVQLKNPNLGSEPYRLGSARAAFNKHLQGKIEEAKNEWQNYEDMESAYRYASRKKQVDDSLSDDQVKRLKKEKSGQTVKRGGYGYEQFAGGGKPSRMVRMYVGGNKVIKPPTKEIVKIIKKKNSGVALDFNESLKVDKYLAENNESANNVLGKKFLQHIAKTYDDNAKIIPVIDKTTFDKLPPLSQMGKVGAITKQNTTAPAPAAKKPSALVKTSAKAAVGKYTPGALGTTNSQSSGIKWDDPNYNQPDMNELSNPAVYEQYQKYIESLPDDKIKEMFSGLSDGTDKSKKYLQWAKDGNVADLRRVLTDKNIGLAHRIGWTAYKSQNSNPVQSNIPINTNSVQKADGYFENQGSNNFFTKADYDGQDKTKALDGMQPKPGPADMTKPEALSDGDNGSKVEKYLDYAMNGVKSIVGMVGASKPLPVWQVPQKWKEYVNKNEDLSKQGFTTDERAILDSRLDKNRAAGVEAIRQTVGGGGSSGAVLAALDGVNRNSALAENDIALKDAQMQRQNLATYGNVLGKDVSLDRQLFEDEYQNAAASKQAYAQLAQSGMQGIIDQSQFEQTYGSGSNYDKLQKAILEEQQLTNAALKSKSTETPFTGSLPYSENIATVLGSYNKEDLKKLYDSAPYYWKNYGTIFNSK